MVGTNATVSPADLARLSTNPLKLLEGMDDRWHQSSPPSSRSLPAKRRRAFSMLEVTSGCITTPGVVDSRGFESTRRLMNGGVGKTGRQAIAEATWERLSSDYHQWFHPHFHCKRTRDGFCNSRCTDHTPCSRHPGQIHAGPVNSMSGCSASGIAP
jgi:hypothetical protein